MYFALVGQMKKQLRQLDTWLEAAGKYAATRSFDPAVLLSARLAPDQFAFARQVQIACDTAKLGCARITGKDAPTQADDEKTLEELRKRVASVLEFVGTLTEKDFDGAATRSVTQPRWEGKTMSGADYFLEHALPNFYFHTTHVYAILRHNGVPLGKKDFLGPLTMKPPAA